MHTGLCNCGVVVVGGGGVMPNRQVFTLDLRACVERYRSVEHIPAMLIRGKVKEGKNPSLPGVGRRSGRYVTSVRS